MSTRGATTGTIEYKLIITSYSTYDKFTKFGTFFTENKSNEHNTIKSSTDTNERDITLLEYLTADNLKV